MKNMMYSPKNILEKIDKISFIRYNSIRGEILCDFRYAMHGMLLD